MDLKEKFQEWRQIHLEKKVFKLWEKLAPNNLVLVPISKEDIQCYKQTSDQDVQDAIDQEWMNGLISDELRAIKVDSEKVFVYPKLTKEEVRDINQKSLIAYGPIDQRRDLWPDRVYKDGEEGYSYIPQLSRSKG